MPKVWFKRICALYQGFIVAACAFEFLAGQKGLEQELLLTID